MLTQGEIAALIKGMAPALKEFVVHTAREEAGKANGAPARTGDGMIDLELIDGLADEVRGLLEEERRATRTLIDELRNEIAQSRAPGNGAEPTPRGFMKGKSFAAFIKYMDVLEDGIDTLRGEVAELRAEIATLRGMADDVLRDAGVWRAGASYGKGACVTHQGTIWAAQVASATGRPGQSDDWRLLVKRPRD